MKTKVDVAIIGGGASGMVAAVELLGSSPELSVTILEKNEAMGRKLRATGSGRCNITNTKADGYTELLKFFAKIGLMTKAYDNGLVYPYSESAADVTELLSARVCELGAKLITSATVTEVKPCSSCNSSNPNKTGERLAESSTEEFFEIFYTTENSGNPSQYDRHSRGGSNTATARSMVAKHVILALGGKAGPTYGTTGDGYSLARGLGHRIVTPVPILTPIECREWAENKTGASAISLAGTRTRGIVSLYKTGNKLFEEAGEIQFTKFGISGICVFNMTRHMRYDRAAGESLGDFYIEMDLFPDRDIREFLRERREAAHANEMVSDILRTVLKENIAAYVLSVAEQIGAAEETQNNESRLRSTRVQNLADTEIEAIAQAVHHLRFCPAQLRGWKEAQATSGGVALDEIDAATSESLLVPRLYITGELADRDFPCGGFNLTNAFLTGICAAQDIVRNKLTN